MNKSKGLVNTIAILLAAGMISSCVPKRADIYGAETFNGSTSKYIGNYMDKESTLDAAETAREGDALADMIGMQYTSPVAYFNDLEQRVGKIRAMDIGKYGTGAAVVDGLKVFFMLRGMFGSTDGGNTIINPPVNGNLGPGSSSKLITPVTIIPYLPN